MSAYQPIKPPSQEIFERLTQNKPAVFGIIVIILAHIIALLGYSIMPDDTPNANSGDLQLKKLTPGTTVQIIKERRPFEVQEVSFFWWLYHGQESKYTYFPIAGDYEFRKDSVFFRTYPGKDKQIIGYPLVKMVKAIYVGYSKGDLVDKGANYRFNSDTQIVTYIDLEGKTNQISLADLRAEFEAKNVEIFTYWLGTDNSGRDLLSRLLFGTHISLMIGLISVLISLVVGVTIGALAGFFGGKVDAVLMWLMTVVWSIPSIMMVVAISIALQSKGMWVTFMAVGLTMWVDIARVVRGQIMSIKQKVYVEAAEALGYSSGRIIFRHILPNVVDPLIVICTSNFAAAILIEAGLSFLGLGVQPPTPSWGNMIKEGYDQISAPDSWHLILFPAGAISLTVLAFNLFGNGLRDAFDPQSRQR